MDEPYALLHFVRSLATHAGDTIRESFYAAGEIDWKADGTIVTDTDTANHAHIVAAAASRLPPLSVYGEEGKAQVSGAAYTLVVDEVDGTAQLARRMPLSVVSIAVVDSSGVPIIGVVDEPLGMVRRQYWAVAGNRAYMSSDGVPDTPLRVSNKDLDGRAMVNAEWWPNAPDGYDFMPSLHEFSKRTGAYVVTLGCVISGFMAVARGDYEACVFAGATTDKLADSAAAKVIIEAAGGRVSNWRGETRLAYDGQQIPGIVASNGRVPLHAALLEVCRSAR